MPLPANLEPAAPGPEAADLEVVQRGPLRAGNELAAAVCLNIERQAHLAAGQLTAALRADQRRVNTAIDDEFEHHFERRGSRLAKS